MVHSLVDFVTFRLSYIDTWIDSETEGRERENAQCSVFYNIICRKELLSLTINSSLSIIYQVAPISNTGSKQFGKIICVSKHNRLTMICILSVS